MAEEKRFYIQVNEERLRTALHNAHAFYDAVKDHEKPEVVKSAVAENVPRLLNDILGSFAIETETFITNS